MKQIIAAAACAILLAYPAVAQVLADRVVVLDPLGIRGHDSTGLAWLGAIRLFGEFSRYSNGSGSHHRWNARTGGYGEILRWDSTTSIALTGMMEVIVDPFSSIGFNPRAIFWEEGVLLSHDLTPETGLQLGFTHRCKHDIDNLEEAVLDNSYEQRTLIYGGLVGRLLARPRPVIDGAIVVEAGGALREDYFLYVTDDRIPSPAPADDPGIRRLLSATSLTGRISIRPAGWRAALRLEGSVMLTLMGATPEHRAGGIRAIGSAPFVELGLDLFNPHGAAFSFFARGEWQRDAEIVPTSAPATLFMAGLRFSGYGDMW